MRIRTRYPTQQQQQTNKFSENFPLKKEKLLFLSQDSGENHAYNKWIKCFLVSSDGLMELFWDCDKVCNSFNVDFVRQNFGKNFQWNY